MTIKRIVLGSFALLSLVGCGGTTVCASIDSANDHFFGSKTECKSTSDGATITITRKDTCDTSKCSANDEKILSTYADCLDKAPACTDGNESDAISGAMACAFATSGLSEDCGSNLK